MKPWPWQTKQKRSFESESNQQNHQDPIKSIQSSWSMCTCYTRCRPGRLGCRASSNNLHIPMAGRSADVTWLQKKKETLTIELGHSRSRFQLSKFSRDSSNRFSHGFQVKQISDSLGTVTCDQKNVPIVPSIHILVFRSTCKSLQALHHLYLCIHLSTKRLNWRWITCFSYFHI